MHFFGWVHDGYVHKRRVSVLSDRCANLIPRDATVLDVGSGDGQLARLITDRRPDISIQAIDASVREGSAIPVEEFDGTSIPYGDDSFDVVMFVDVLHHTDDPTTLLSEAVRVSRRTVLIKDHTLQGSFA